MLQNIAFAQQQALDARKRAAECEDIRLGEKWLTAADMWEALAQQYELLLGMSKTA